MRNISHLIWVLLLMTVEPDAPQVSPKAASQAMEHDAIRGVLELRQPVRVVGLVLAMMLRKQKCRPLPWRYDKTVILAPDRAV
jgi:hypothetical protein